MIIGIDANEANVVNRVGSNQYAFQVLRQLYQLDKKNLYQIYLKSAPLRDLPKSNPRWQYKILKPGFLWTQWRLPLSLFSDKPKPDVFFTLGHYAPRFSPVPTIISIMDLAFLRYPKSFLKKDLKKLKSWTKYSAKKALHLFTISEASKKDIQKFYNIAPGKITVIYPGIDTLSISKTNNKTKTFNSDYLLYLGTLQPRKNLDNLIKAVAKLPHHLVIAGKKGWMYQSLFHLVKKLKIENKVTFTGFIPSSNLNSLIKNAKLLILPSFYEGFGIPVLQAMSLGTPVLVSKNSSLKEIVGNTGSFIKSPFEENQVKQGIIGALALPIDKQQRLIKLAKKRAATFSWKSSGKKVLEVINEINL